MSGTAPPPPQPGEVFAFASDDYRVAAIGPLVAHIKEAIHPATYYGVRWWSVVADIADGIPEAHGGWRESPMWIREGSMLYTRRVPPQ